MEIKKIDGRQVVDYMARDYGSLLEAMKSQVPAKLPEWTDYESEADFGHVLLQLFAHMGDILSYYQDRVANEAFLGTARDRRSIIQHLKLIGYRLATAVPAAARLTIDFSGGFPGPLTIGPGDAFATKSQKDKPSVRFEYTGKAVTIDNGDLSDDMTYAIQVEQGRLIREDILGESDGRPNQRFPLSHKGLIFRSLGESAKVNPDITVWIELDTQIDSSWTLQETLAFSREDQHDYAVEIDENDQATVLFGSGTFGAVVPHRALVKARYRVGGGTLGNVPALTIDTIVDAPALTLASAKVTNKKRATGGAERETIGHAVDHAPEVFRSLNRAVTAADYEALALNFKGVGKVRAERGDWNKIILYVAPEGGGSISDLLRANLLAYFEDKRPLSTIIEIEDVDYVKIYLSAKVGLKAYYAEAEMRRLIEQKVKELLAFEKVKFGRPVYLSKFYEAIELIDGVEYVDINEFRLRSKAKNTIQPIIALSKYQVPKIPDDLDEPADQPYLAGLDLTLEGGL